MFGFATTPPPIDVLSSAAARPAAQSGFDGSEYLGGQEKWSSSQRTESSLLNWLNRDPLADGQATASPLTQLEAGANPANLLEDLAVSDGPDCWRNIYRVEPVMYPASGGKAHGSHHVTPFQCNSSRRGFAFVE
ncbi:hypothetical protein PC128_g24573 [Phytophthora cactorum]|nr:hypothetical protein PC128_g24573 [Phytophthora cactorum]